MSKFSRADVSTHSKDGDAWVVIDNNVLDVSKFARMHPGGKGILLNYAGKDATEAFYQYHRKNILSKYLPRLSVGVVEGEEPVDRQLGDFSTVPFAEPGYLQGQKSVYYQEKHHIFRKNVRALLEKEVIPMAATWEENGKAPTRELIKKLGHAGLWAARIAPTPYQGKMFAKNFFGIPGSEYDIFCELICHEEVIRIGCPGLTDGLGSGLVIGLPAVINFGTPKMRTQVVPKVLLGEKTICLAISEPVAGSDVANIETTAELTPDGKHYIVNGVKKWITNGTFSDYFVTAVRTGGKGMKGLSMLLIERSEGVETEIIKTSYSPAAGTAYITFENVKVPAENLLGKEGKGFPIIMSNFNHERWVIIVGGNRANRLMVEECMLWANQRMVFGKKLISQPVVRAKLADMVAQLEACHNWMENITYQMNTLSYKDQARYLAGPIALCKYQVTRTTNSLADHAQQIFGGRGISRGGMGQVVERLARAQKFSAILGGSEEVMADLGIRQALRMFPEQARL